MARLTLLSLQKDLPQGSPLFKKLSLELVDGELLVLLGESGCGKTSLLKMIAGLDENFSGDILINDHSIRRTLPEHRNIGFMTQSASLFPHMTIEENILFPLKVRRISLQEQRSVLTSVAEALVLPDLLSRLPHQLSGGQKQRVALARCLAQKPDVFLMDEPLSSLDNQAKIKLRGLIKQVQKQLGVTAIYVTHDQEEATQLADRIAVLGKHAEEETQLLQCASPNDIYHHPVNTQVARILGSPLINLLPIGLGKTEHKNPAEVTLDWQGTTHYLGVRPNAWGIRPKTQSDETHAPRLSGKIKVTEMLNGNYFAYWSSIQRNEDTAPWVVQVDKPILSGEAVVVDLKPGVFPVFDISGNYLTQVSV